MNASSISSKSPIFWILLTLTFSGGLFFAHHFFPYAFALLNINISMTRHEALKKASLEALKHGWGPKDFSQAASFETDSETKNFIELKAGGVSAVTAVIDEGWYNPYFWKIRHFKTQTTQETAVYFMPDGRPYGFQEILSENDSGAALDAQQARMIAETKASTYWGILFDQYQRAESSQEKKISGRIDHHFAYERIGKKIADAPYRLTLGISGDRFTELSYSIKVPETFTREYEHMRSSNNTIAFASLFIMALLYIGVGCTLGLAYLVHQNALWWQPAAIFAVIIASLQALNEVNELPLAWMEYQTALSITAFLLGLFSSIIAQFLLYSALLTLIFTIAEGLSRTAFKNHLILWQLFKNKTASSWQVIGRTIGSYLLIGFTLAYSIGFYAFAHQILGWWNPSETFLNPNIIATYAPWFSSLSQSIMAGCMEEALFRAIPLAGAALIGQRFGKRNLFIAIAFIAQAIIFGAAHANYAAQPAYTRVVELIVPSFIFGGLYLVYGLLPAMLTHTLFDIFWFALPLFLAHGMMINKMIVVFCSLAPLWIIAYAVYRYGRPHRAGSSAYNSAWRPKLSDDSSDYEEQEEHEPQTIPRAGRFLLALASIGAAACWFATTRFIHDNESLRQPKKVIEQSLDELINREYPLVAAEPWHRIIFSDVSIGQPDLFIWQTARNQFAKLMGTYLPPAYWIARVAQFTGDLTARAEEYRFYFDGTGELKRVTHIVPESLPGANLAEPTAEKKVHELFNSVYTVDPKMLSKISAESTKQPERTDWVFKYQDTNVVLPEGQARFQVDLSGDTVADYQRLIFVPESWQRTQQEKETIYHIIALYAKMILIGALAVFGLIIARRWRRMSIPYHVFFVIAGMVFIKGIGQLLNVWPLIEATFVTSEPYLHQQWTMIGRMLLQISMYAVSLGIGAAVASLHWQRVSHRHTWHEYLFVGCATGLIVTAVRSLMTAALLSPIPLFPDYRFAGAHCPALGFVGGIINPFISSMIALLLITCAADMLTNNWRRHRLLGCILIAGLFVVNQATEIHSIASWIVPATSFAIIVSVLYAWYLRHYRPALPYVIGTFVVCQVVQQLTFNAYPGVISGALIALAVVSLISIWWSRQLA
jgi:hypothetical protein